MGLAPGIAWTFATDAELVSLDQARETGDLFAVDSSGGVYRLDRRGRIGAVSRGLHDVHTLHWSDTGDVGLVIAGDDNFSLLNESLEIAWTSSAPRQIVGSAIDAYGHNVVLSLDGGNNVIFNVDREKTGSFTTLHPLKFLEFIVGRPGIIGAAEYGLLCRHDMDGNEVWSEKLWATMGDMSIIQDGKSIYLAQFAHGVQSYDVYGSSLAAYIVEGTPSRVSASFFGERVVVATVEKQLFWLDSDGALLWAAETPEEAVALICDPLGEWLIIGFQSGRVMRLDWESTSTRE